MLFLQVFLTCSCRVQKEESLQPARGEFSVMSFNLQHYGLEDRDGDGQRNDPKPEKERRAVLKTITHVNPDILVLQEMGNPVIYRSFKRDLTAAGLKYDNEEFIRRGQHENNIAVLTRFPIVARQSHTNDTYSIGKANLHVARGIIDVDIEIAENYILRLMGAHLKSKVYHPLGQTEMRRNESRIIGQHVRSALKKDPSVRLLIVGDLNDLPNSAVLREITGSHKRVLTDIRPTDASGDTWTHRQAGIDVYQRLDYMLASPNLNNELVRQKTHVIDIPATRTASDHRPLLVVFKTNAD
jgi:endonuclease/exonuclease/phosphatase family metal-dependent hydrolase